jgi:hypothetical protein
MNDEFLYRYQRQPRPEFAKALYKRISAGPALSITPRFSPARQTARGLLVIGTVFAVMFAISPDVRTRVRGQIVRTE